MTMIIKYLNWRSSDHKLVLWKNNILANNSETVPASPTVWSARSVQTRAKVAIIYLGVPKTSASSCLTRESLKIARQNQNRGVLHSFCFRTSRYMLFHIVTIMPQERLPTPNTFSEVVTKEIRRQHPEPDLHKPLLFSIRWEVTSPKTILEFWEHIKTLKVSSGL